MIDPCIEDVIRILARFPGLGPRSARRATLMLVKRQETLLQPLIAALQGMRDTVKTCSVCGSLGGNDPCTLCSNLARDNSVLCVVEDIASIWAFERSGLFRGRYHVLGGTLSALEGIAPEDLNIEKLFTRVQNSGVEEVILALGATVEGQTTAHYLADRLRPLNHVRLSRLAFGVPMGGELDHLDDGTLETALRARQPF